MRFSHKVLLVSSFAPPAISGSAQFLYHLLSPLDPTSYSLFTSRRNIAGEKDEAKRMLAGTYYFYEDSSVFKIKLFPFTYNERTSIATKVFQKARRGVIKLLRAGSMIRAGLKIIRDEKIGIILGTSDIGTSALLTYVLSLLSGKPYALLMFDLYRENEFPFPWKHIARIAEPILFTGAKAVVTVTEDARDRYVQAYGSGEKYHVLPVCLDERAYPRLPLSGKEGQTHTIVFTGNIYWAQQESLENMIRAVNALPDEHLQFEIYTPAIPNVIERALKKAATSGNIEIKSALPEEIPSILHRADILFVPLSWHTKSPTVIRTVIPFKLMEYMLSGKPMLLHAPPDAYVSKYARKEEFAHVVDEENIESLKAGVRKLLHDKQYVKKITDNAKATFYKYHQASIVSYKLWEIIEHIPTK